VLELSKAMARRLPTTLVSFGGKAISKQIGDLRVRVLQNWIHAGRFKFDPFNPWLVRHLRQADVIHYHQTYNMMSTLAAVYARLAKKPIFTTDLGGGGLALHHHMDLTRWYAGHLHISEFSRNNFGHRDLESASVILGGVDTVKFSPDEHAVRKGEVLYVGRLLPHKGINYLIDAVDENTELVIAGRRWAHAQNYFELLQRQAADKQVHFHEDWDDADIVRAYQRALCIVLPSVYTSVFGEKHAIPELLGQTLIEGMACGTPAICTDVGSLPEVVEDGVTGFVVPANDPITLGERLRYLKTHPPEAEKMGRAARRRVLEKFTWDATVDRCLRAYQEVLPGS